MQRRRSDRSASVALLLLLAGTIPARPGPWASELASDAFQTSVSPAATRELQLEVFVNGAPIGLIGAFQQQDDGTLTATAEMLRGLGLKAPAATNADEQVHLSQLPGVSYRLDERSQSLYIVAEDAARVPHTVDVNPRSRDWDLVPQSSTGAVLNYSLFASSEGAFTEGINTFSGLSGALDGRVFGPYGTFSQSAIATTASADVIGLTRLQTTWTYSDPDRLLAYRAGDTMSGGLSWTRPVWLGGLQAQRNFGLRPDLITLPVPAISGSAAVPSTIDVYTQNVRTFTGEVPAGPYELTNLPVTTGAGTTNVVLRDAMGRETTTSVPFYTSNQLLRGGLYDFSTEIGFPRRYYGIQSYNYDGRLMGSASLRYGLSDALTLEAHTEGGEDLINGGGGIVFPWGGIGLASFALAASNSQGENGAQIAGSVEMALNGVSLYARTQRTIGDYRDIACVTAGEPSPLNAFTIGFTRYSVCPPKALDQVNLGIPLPFDRSTIGLSYTQLESALGFRDRIIGLSFNRPFLAKSTIFASAFTDLDNDNGISAFAGISLPLGGGANAFGGLESGAGGARGFVSASKADEQDVGSYGWRVRVAQGDIEDRSAMLSYRTSVGRIEAGVQQFEGAVQGTAQFDGSVALAGGGVFFGNRIDDAFAVVDVGAPDVDVQYENRSVGKTDQGGRLLVPYLNAYQSNKISIDPKNLPVDAEVPKTRELVMPADRGGVVVQFNVTESTLAALVTFVDGWGSPIKVGARGHLQGADEVFVIGYDGQAYLRNLSAHNVVAIELPDGDACHAAFDYAPHPGEQVVIGAVTCQ